MSGILKHKKLLFMAISVTALELLGVLLLRSYLYACVFIVIDIIIVVGLLISRTAYKKLRSQLSVFEAGSHVRNVDYLIIGENCDEKELGISGFNSVQVVIPSISIWGAYHIMRRTYSIVHEGGTVIFVLKRRNLTSDKVGILESIFFHQITIKELKLERAVKLKRLIFFVKPIEIIKILSGYRVKRLKEHECNNEVINGFCKERGLKLIVYAK